VDDGARGESGSGNECGGGQRGAAAVPLDEQVPRLNGRLAGESGLVGGSARYGRAARRGGGFLLAVLGGLWSPVCSSAEI
jgi:hypothetical protein